MDATTITTTVLTQPYQLMTMLVAIYFVLRPLFTDLHEGRTDRPATGETDPTERKAA